MARRMIGVAWLAVAALTVGLMTLGCGSAEDSEPSSAYFGYDAPAAAAPQMARAMSVEESAAADTFDTQAAPAPGMAMSKEMAAPAQPQPAAPAQPQVVVKEVEVESSARKLGSQGPAVSFDMASVQAAFVQQERIIVRTVDMALTVGDVAQSVDDIGDVARKYSGWVVGADRSATHVGRVSVRVPAQSLDDAVKDIRAIGLEVMSESTTSQDVTDEYVDSRSRLTSLRATEQALLNLFERAQTVEAALAVQQELAKLQAEIEALLGRIKFLEETAAFSLINVGLSLAAGEMDVEAGDDRTLNVGEPARFRATFTPPEGIYTFSFVWDFGDGRERVYGERTVATSNPGERVTATVHHAYEDDLESPYIVSLDITGFGDAGQVEGADTFTVTAKQIPPIEVFLTAEYSAEQGEENRVLRFVHAPRRAIRLQVQVGLRRRQRGRGGRACGRGYTDSRDAHVRELPQSGVPSRADCNRAERGRRGVRRGFPLYVHRGGRGACNRRLERGRQRHASHPRAVHLRAGDWDAADLGGHIQPGVAHLGRHRVRRLAAETAAAWGAVG